MIYQESGELSSDLALLLICSDHGQSAGLGCFIRFSIDLKREFDLPFRI